jgi:polysaccharide export outer membrane protein
MRSLAVVLLLAAIAAPSQGQEQRPIVTSSVSEYTLRPGDVLRIEVWGREEFSGQYQIDQNGRFRYPVLGNFDTSELSVAQVRDSLRVGLETLFNAPFVTVSPLFRVAVLGEVRAPGLYTVDPTLTAIDVVALAGGAGPDGNSGKIRLVRGGESSVMGVEEAMRGMTLAEIGIRSGDQVYVPRKGITTQEWFILIQLAQIAISVAILVNTFGL